MNMQQALMRDPEFMELVRDRGFAEAVYGALCNREFISGSGDRWSCSWRYAGGFVASARGEGEDYMDYYCGPLAGDDGAGDPSLHDRFMAIAGRLGWSEITPEQEAGQAIEAIAMLEEAEAREEGPMPGWYGTYARLEAPGPWAGGTTLIARIHSAARSGRIGTEAEFDRMRARAFPSREAAEIVAARKPGWQAS